jgi:translation elongation factor P/translation initiation factor 5A
VKVIASSLRKGNIVDIDGKLGVIVATENIHPGKGTPVTQMDVRRISDGVKLSLRFKTTDQVERAFVEDRKHQYMYQDGDGFHFMNMESYDQVALQSDIIGDLSAYLQSEMEVTISIHEGTPVAIELPPNRTDHQEPDRCLVLQARRAVEWGAHHGAALRHYGHQDRGDDRRRQLRRARQRLILRAESSICILNIYS